ncbi:TIR domain-containing protein [Lacticaseibacillus paracasei]|uniref:TIR domain-containing protein n=1 Tax=Lacticaseibacillus paracasei TaxID=1597 RepID=UPI0005EB37C7|nr:TIR domain-containing protein [Lacticaseibacillus paracasei]
MTYRNKIYVAFDGDSDMSYYTMLEAWAKNKNVDFEFYNAHDLNTARDSSKEESIKRDLRIRFANSKLFILLIGEHTKNLTKFVKWEIEMAIKLQLPIIAVNLNDSKTPDKFEPSSLKNQLAIFIPYKLKIINYAINNWPARDHEHRKNNEIENYHYIDSVYKKLELD